MTTVKYDVGDILTWRDDDDCYATAVIVRWHTKDVFVEGISLKRYTDYDLFLKSKEKDDFELAHGVPEAAFYNYKVVGHIDISGMSNDEVKTHLDCAIKMKWYEREIYHAIEAYWAIMKLCELKGKTDDNCCCDGLRADNAMLKSQIACMEGRIESLVQKCGQLDADNRYLSAKVKHLTIGNNRKNGKIGSLQASLTEETLKRKQAEAELDEKTEVLDGIYHSDIVCENNKLRNENKVLNEIVSDFKSTCDNCEARSENERLRADNEKLRAANASFSQKIKCAEKYFDSAATALYEGREHLSMAVRCTTGD